MSAPAVARLSGPGEILAVLPSLCGFPPQESLVLLSLRGPRKRLGLTARVDLPEPPDEDGLAGLCADRMLADGASCVVVVVLSELARRSSLVVAVRDALAERGVDVLEALHVRDGRWTSYACQGACCPAQGTPVPTAPPALGLLQAEQVVTGRAVLPSRDDLVRSLKGAGYDDVQVRVELHPAWSSDWITERGRAALAAHGISPPGPAPQGPVVLNLLPTKRSMTCPRCGSDDVELTSEFGATACKALYRCAACLEPFEHVKEI